MSLPLDGVLVADFSRVLAGPLAAATLADLGADVIKVERPRVGDDTRHWGPPWTEASSSYFESANRSKRSVELDLNDSADLRLARELAGRCDVLIENFRTGMLEARGLGYAEVEARNPGVVYASVTGFGSGEGAGLPGYDFLIQAVGGLMSITGSPEEPTKVGVALVDVLTSKDAVVAILAALRARDQSGRGQHVEVNLLSSLLGAMVNQASGYLTTGQAPPRMGNQHPSIAPYESLAAKDGRLVVCCGTDGQFRSLAAALGIPALADDPRFRTNAHRVAHRGALVQQLEERLGADTVGAWVERLTAGGVPAGKVGSLAGRVRACRAAGPRPHRLDAGGTCPPGASPRLLLGDADHPLLPAPRAGGAQPRGPPLADRGEQPMSTTDKLAPFQPLDAAGIDDLLSADERAVRASVRQLCDERIEPYVADWFERGQIDDVSGLAKELGALGVLGMHLEGYGCAGMSATEYGLACLELEATDSGIRSLVSVQGSLAMFAIWRWGSEEQKNEWLPRMATGEAIGCFGLTESDAGSDPGSMRTHARRDGDDWVLNGGKMWITNGSVASVAVVWAQTDEGVRGFVVPTDTAGFSAPEIKHKMSLRASVTSELVLDDVRLPASAMLPEVRGLKGPLSCLNEARYGIVWGAMGAARSSLSTALSYADQRLQFGKPISGFQLTQQKLVDMNLEYTKGVLLALHLGRRKDAGTLRPEQVSLGKLNNVREALDICRTARTILGANGISLEYPVIRHMNNLESVLTYEGTVEMHTLVIGEAMTGRAAFR